MGSKWGQARHSDINSDDLTLSSAVFSIFLTP